MPRRGPNNGGEKRDRILRAARLRVPHPRMHLRRFVLRPLADLAGGIVVPGTGQTVAGLLAGLAAQRIARIDAD